MKSLRNNKNIKVDYVAKILGLSINTIRNVEQGYNPPPNDSRLRLWLNALGETKRFEEAKTFKAACKMRREIRYQPRNPANEHLDRLLDAYDHGMLTDADINLLRMTAPGQYQIRS